ncbi:unnamed protein product [Phytomonas sp. EM1]|nr:unnamed protein product [Phytomonas sp. EM1]|eukprot:CCW60460.1 unnamed protein product [Phytomonas sp. isolate EM1]
MDRDEAEVTYKTLTALMAPEPWTFPSCIINYCEGEVNENDQLDGFGRVETSMGFTYEGEFCNGRMEGAGVISWADGYTVKGNFKHGAANGTGQLIWPNGDYYEGDLVNSIRQGIGKLTSHRGQAVYQGGWAHGKRNGRGWQQFPDGNVYDGEWLDDQRHGHGALIYSNGDCYEGDWVRDERHGSGEMAWRKGNTQYMELYEGTWVQGLPSGEGRSTTIMYVDTTDVPIYNPITEEKEFVTPSNFVIPLDCGTNVYEGSFVDGIREGKGTFYYADGSRFEGYWHHGKKNGTGKFIGAISKPFYATFVDDIPQNLPALSGPGCEDAVSSIYIEDLCTIADESETEVVASAKTILLRFNPWMKSLFRKCYCLQNDIAFITTPDKWCKHRLPGLVSMPQLLRFLNDVHILGGIVMLSTVIRCVINTIQAERTDNYSIQSSESIASEENKRKSIFIDDAYSLRANLNYRQFTEVLMRLANVVVVGPSFVTIGQKLSNFIEERLSGNVSVSPLFPQTRAYAADLKPHLDSLRHIFHALVELEHTEPIHRFLSVRFLMRYLNPLIVKHGLELRSTICELFPLRTRYSCAPGLQSSLPSGFNMPQGDLGYEMFSKASGDMCALDAEVASNFELTLEDFVEAVVLISLKCSGNDEEGTVSSIGSVIEEEILPLGIYDM